MQSIRYENHVSIKQNKKCPFKFDEGCDGVREPCNWHKNIEILLVNDGVGYIQYGTSNLPVSAGDVVIVGSEELHRPWSDTCMIYSFVIIDESFCAENGLDTQSLSFDKVLRDTATRELFITLGNTARAYAASPEPLNVARYRAAVLSLLINIISEHSEKKKEQCKRESAGEEYVKRVIEHINSSYASTIDLESLSSMCGVTKYHLAREFKRLTGQTVFGYVGTLRCSKAEYLLSNGKSVTDTALECGFESISYFSRTYKRLMGVSPSSVVKSSSKGSK
jgi:AraC-like DNA-binding protein